MAALAVTIGSGSTPPVSSGPERPVAHRRTAPPTDVTPTDVAPAPRVLFVGDSLAAQLGHHATVALHEAGVEADVAAAWGMGLFTREQYDMGTLQPNPSDQSLLGLAAHAVAEFDPDVVAVYSNHNYWPPHPRSAQGTPITWESPEFPGMVRTLLTELVRRLSVGGAKVYLIAPIPLFPPDDQPEDTSIWDAYMAVREELGVEVVTPGDFMARADGERVDALPDCTGAPRPVRPGIDVHLTYFGAGLLGSRAATAIADRLPSLTPSTGTRPTGPGEPPVALLPDHTGYRLVSCDGATFHFGRHTTPLGSAAGGQGRSEGDPVVAAADVDDGEAALLLTRAGAVLRLGDPDDPTAPTVARVPLADGEVAVGIATTPDDGFWVATSAGRVHPLADAPALGGVEDSVVALAAAPDGRGYYLLTAGGRVVGFGEAPTFGDLPDGAGEPVALAIHPSGDGYWVLDRAGGVHAFGAARPHGEVAALPMWHQSLDREKAGLPPLPVPADQVPPVDAVALLPTPTGRGYWVALASGAVCHFGDAPTLGGIHRAEVDPLMTFVGEPYWPEGPCTSPPRDRLMSLTALFTDVRKVLTTGAR
ncbi:MAG TPA: SGNH hydrolase domain-containing protein [Acidimicrobiales bacterium]|nr:SGNH hydrolase domain-containing protein [Acidimicrobiales bacterium]